MANNVRDIDTDRGAGKRTLAVIAGRTWGVALFAFCLLGGLLLPAAAVVFDWLPAGAAAQGGLDRVGGSLESAYMTTS